MKYLRLILLITVLATMLIAPLGVSAAPPRPMPGDAGTTTISSDTVADASTATVSSLGLRLREGPSTSDSVILVLAKGETVFPCAGPVYDDGIWWAYVYAERNGTQYEGFCAAEYLSGYEDMPDETVTPDGAVQYKVTAYYGLKLREGAGTAYDVATIAPRGTILNATSNTATADGYTWAEIVYSGQKLWAVMDYLLQVE